MISVQEVEALHQLLIEQFGGSSGIRDSAGLASALARPFQSFAGQSLYPSPLEQASALLESILSNHPFVDGTKEQVIPLCVYGCYKMDMTFLQTSRTVMILSLL